MCLTRFTGIKNLKIQARINEPSIYFEFDISTAAEPASLQTGTDIELVLDDPETIGGLTLFRGKALQVKRSLSTEGKAWNISGRHTGFSLVKQKYTRPCKSGEGGTGLLATDYSMLSILIDILNDTGITLSLNNPGLQGIHLLDFWFGDSINWFCGIFKTKKDAINQLFSVFSKITGQKVKWYVSLSGELRWFILPGERGQIIDIKDDNPQLIDYTITEDANNIINDLEGYSGEQTDIYRHVTDPESIERFGLSTGEPITDTTITHGDDLVALLEKELAIKAVPIYTATATFNGLFFIEPGRQVRFPDSSNYGEITLTVMDCNVTGEDSHQQTSLNFSTDENAMSETNTFEAIKIIAKHVNTEPVLATCLYGTMEGSSQIVVKPLNSQGTVSATPIGTFVTGDRVGLFQNQDGTNIAIGNIQPR
jgi:hypothetical protein